MALERAPSAPLSSTVFLQFKHEHMVGLHRLPALKQSQYKAMHFDLGQLHPDGFSCKGPSSSVAEHRRSSIPKLPSEGPPLGRFKTGGGVSDLLEVSVERFPRLTSVGESPLLEGDSPLGIETFFGMTTFELYCAASFEFVLSTEMWEWLAWAFC